MNLNEKIIKFNKSATLNEWRHWLIQVGCTPISDKKYIRPGKNKGNSIELYLNDNIWQAVNFSSSFDLKTGKNKTALFNFIKNNMFNGNAKETALYLKLIEDKGTPEPKPKLKYDYSNIQVPVPVEIKLYDELQYRYLDDFMEEEVSLLMQYSKNPRWVIDNQIAAKYPVQKKERVYSICVNPFSFVNSIHPKYNIPENLQKVVETQGFYNIDVTKDELIEFIVNGYIILLGKFNAYPIFDKGGDYSPDLFRKIKGYSPVNLPKSDVPIFDIFLKRAYRNKSNFVSSDIFGVDVDGTITLEEALSKDEIKSALFIYTTKSHTNERNRFRIIFDLPGVVKNSKVYEQITKYYRYIFNGDPKSTDASRIWYTNPNTTIYDLTTGEIINYTNGKRND